MLKPDDVYNVKQNDNTEHLRASGWVTVLLMLSLILESVKLHHTMRDVSCYAASPCSAQALSISKYVCLERLRYHCGQ